MFLTYQEVADRLGVHRKTVTAWAAKGDLPVVYLTPRTPRVREDALDKWVAARTRSRVLPDQRTGRTGDDAA